MTDDPHRPIIVADDEPATRALLVRQLERAGYEVHPCADGQQALTTIQRLGAGIVIADWSMPEMDGLELCRAVQELREMHALGTIYFILLTAHSDKTDVVRGFDAGVDDYLTKPYNGLELLARLRAGERISVLQDQLVRRQIEVQKVNSEMAALNNKLRKMANTDALTGLANRRHVFDRLDETWSLAERRGHPLACTMLDLDHFKQINDTHGHAAGDEVLKSVTTNLRQHTRCYDICGRFGGEEFIIICPETVLEGACTLAERIREAVAARPVAVGDASISITVSAGVAIKRPAHTKPDALIAQADAVLYQAKDNGRNQVWAADADGREYAVSATALAT